MTRRLGRTFEPNPRPLTHAQRAERPAHEYQYCPECDGLPEPCGAMANASAAAPTACTRPAGHDGAHR